jgi:hypothetical protein
VKSSGSHGSASFTWLVRAINLQKLECQEFPHIVPSTGGVCR